MTTSLDDSRRTKKTTGAREIALVLTLFVGTLIAAGSVTMLAISAHA